MSMVTATAVLAKPVEAPKTLAAKATTPTQIMALADSSGNVSDADLYKYGPWGEPKSINNTDQWSGSRFRYTGQTVLPTPASFTTRPASTTPLWAGSSKPTPWMQG